MNSLIFSQTADIQGFALNANGLGTLHLESTIDDYVICVDDSGDTNLDPIDPRFPMSNLVLYLIREGRNIDFVVPRLQQLQIDFLIRQI